jgi:AcrR family transcriptional regulator
MVDHELTDGQSSSRIWGMPATARPRRQPADVRREQILDAAERVFAGQGLDASTMADVARAADVAKGTVYLYYASKAELLAALRARYLERMSEAIGDRAESSGTPTGKRLDTFIAGLFDFSLEHRRLHRLLFQEAGVSEEDAFAGATALLGRIVADGVANREIKVADPSVTAAFLLHGIHGALVEALHAPEPDRNRYVRTTRALVRAALSLGGPPARRG